jgi:hypothetical protein
VKKVTKAAKARKTAKRSGKLKVPKDPVRPRKRSKRGVLHQVVKQLRSRILAFEVTAAERASCERLAEMHGIDPDEVLRRALRIAAELPQLLSYSSDAMQALAKMKALLPEPVGPSANFIGFPFGAD